MPVNKVSVCAIFVALATLCDSIPAIWQSRFQMQLHPSIEIKNTVKDMVLRCAVLASGETAIGALLTNSGMCKVSTENEQYNNTNPDTPVIILTKDRYKVIFEPEYSPPTVDKEYEYAAIPPPAGLDSYLHMKISLTLKKGWSRFGFNLGPKENIKEGGDVYLIMDTYTESVRFNRMLGGVWDTIKIYEEAPPIPADNLTTLEITHTGYTTRVVFDNYETPSFEYVSSNNWTGAAYMNFFTYPDGSCLISALEFFPY